MFTVSALVRNVLALSSSIDQAYNKPEVNVSILLLKIQRMKEIKDDYCLSSQTYPSPGPEWMTK